MLTALPSDPPAGVYEAVIRGDGRDVRIGRAVPPDRTQLGVVDDGGERSDAARLDLDDLSFTLDGQEHRAPRLA